ncbi:hypothetical protein ABID76_002740 [Burkholderia ambifaria]
MSTVCEIDVTCAVAVRMSTLGWKKILTIPKLRNDCDSMCATSLTVVPSVRS